MSRWRLRGAERRLLVSGMCGMICFAIAGASFAAGTTFDGVYTGTMSRTKGPDETCPAEVNASATIKGDVLTFTAGRLQGFGLDFHPHEDGSFGDLFTDEGGATVLIRGHIVEDVIEADVTNPPCDYHLHLQKETKSQ